ncbi:uncharacterized protein YbcI [Aneurinibacillus soli]|uniref:Uncharacterized protein n=1 Tax=Aneurinibacillus soli TaxID=1500254 RepID=A0A0U5AXK7_9BACL|nr:DUF2294 domain-containing protein [Aneurinibacillus soli]PYE61668.1 uncharacterized protein YbcI [Aneurinibacillus soli]BAU28474.1 hypothetical protein CB4_02648 [Aneurinibacillus soli]
MTKNTEHQFSMLVRELRKEYVGNGPKEITTRFIDSWAISEMKGNLTNIEKFMMNSEEGKRMVNEARTEFVKKIYQSSDVLAKFEELVQAKIVRVFSDINIEEDIAMTIFVFDKPLKLRSK